MTLLSWFERSEDDNNGDEFRDGRITQLGKVELEG